MIFFYYYYYKGLLKNTLLAPEGELQYAYKDIVKVNIKLC